MNRISYDVEYMPEIYDSLHIEAASSNCCVNFTLRHLSGITADNVTLSLNSETTTNGNGIASFSREAFTSQINTSEIGSTPVNATLTVQDGNRTSNITVTATVSVSQENYQADTGANGNGLSSTSPVSGFTIISSLTALLMIAFFVIIRQQ